MANIKIQGGPNNYDTSPSHAGNLVREIQKYRQDFDKAKREFLELIKDKQRTDSPYAPDRTTIDHKRIHKNPGEGDWRKVSISGDSDSYQVVYHDFESEGIPTPNEKDPLKKLDII